LIVLQNCRYLFVDWLFVPLNTGLDEEI